jgi:protein-L-isoaspartate O-methyltransferase
VLEVGCGSGQLTRGLAARGLRVTALQPGTSLMALARQNLAGAGEVEFVNARFEDALLPRGRFRAVFSASAFTGLTLRSAGRRPLTCLFPVGRSPLCSTSGLRSRAASQIRKQRWLP